MKNFSFLFSPTAEALGHSLLYSLWQAFIIFIGLRLILKFIPNASARIKYFISYIAYTAIAAWFFVTVIRQIIVAQSTQLFSSMAGEDSFKQISSHHLILASSSLSFSYLNNYLPWIVAFYLLGIVCFAMKLVYNFFETNKLRTVGLTALDRILQERILQLAKKINIHQEVRAFFSWRIDTPMMIGFFRPVILLPFAMINRLSTQQVEAILLHELAHIRRNDYLLNVFQSVIDTVLFFNPFTWWITKKIREEREKCCDEMVLQLSDPYQYAHALLALQETWHKQSLVMTAVGKRSQLLYRIKNIMEMKNNHINLRQKFIALLLIITATVSVAWLTPNQGKAAKSDPQIHAFKKSFLLFDNVSKAFSVNNLPFAEMADTTPKVIAPLTPKLPSIPTIAVAPSAPRNTKPLLPLPANAAPVPASTLPPMPPLPPKLPQLTDTVIPLNNYFNSEEWKKQEAEIKKSTASVQKYFNSPEWKKQQLMIQKNASNIQKYFSSPAWKKQQQEIQKNSANIQKYFNSPEWKKQQEEIQKNAAKMQKYFNSPEWKKQQQEIQKNAAKMQKYFNSPEWKKQQEEIKRSTDSITAYFKSADWKKQQENIKKSMAETQQFFQSSEWKKQQQELKKMMEENKEMMKDSKAKKK